MTEQQAAAYAKAMGYLQIEKVEGSQEERMDLYGNGSVGSVAPPPGKRD